MGLGVMLVIEPEFGIGNSVRRGTNVGADASRVGLEGEHGEVAHDLHVFAALVPFGNLDFDGRGIGSLSFTGSDSGFLPRSLFLAIFDGGDATLEGTHAVEVFIQFVLVIPREFSAQVLGTSEHQVKHLTIERVGFCELSALVGFSEKPVEHATGIRLCGDRLRR